MNSLSLYTLLTDRNKGLISSSEQEILKNSVVAVAGAGGVGGITAECLVRMGVGGLVIADPECYDKTNLNRQLGSLNSTIGKNKAEIIGNRMLDINPSLNLKIMSRGLQSDNYDIFFKDANLVIDAIDYFAPKVRKSLYDIANKNNLSVISTPAIGFGTLMMNFSPPIYALENLLDSSGQFIMKKLLGGNISYLTDDFFSRLSEGKIPSNACAVNLAGSIGAFHCYKTLSGHDDLVVMPLAIRVDPFLQEQVILNLDGI